jgi:S-adenosylhomocysteine hydrolase
VSANQPFSIHYLQSKHYNDFRMSRKNPDSRNLPLLNFTLDLYPDVNLENVYVIGEQHIVSSTFELIKALFKKGLKPDNLSLIGKCYSTNPYIYAQMVLAGIDVSIRSLTFNNREEFDIQYQKHVLKFFKDRLSSLNGKNIKKVIFISDGGILNQLAQTRSLRDTERLAGIEQTTSGYDRLKTLKLKFPIINVARSEAKLIHESPFIARLTVDRLFRSLKALNLFPKKVLIIGNGSIGGQLYHLLKNIFEVSTYDLTSSKTMISKNDFEVSLSNFDLIIGATGKRTITRKQHKLLKKNAILASASSSDREFDAVYLRRKINKPLTDCHQDLFIDNIYLLNCGFPVIFDTSFDVIDTDEFQLTRSLLLSGILQAATYRESEKGFISLDPEDQRELIQKFLSISQTRQKRNKIKH